MSKEVTCIKKRSTDYKDHERISAIGGGKKSDGTSWSKSEDEAIKAIEAGTESFYVRVNGLTVDVVVAKHDSRKYLKTTADDYKPNNESIKYFV
jgi:hypothetical protein